jgi:predicted dehydrogenase
LADYGVAVLGTGRLGGRYVDIAKQAPGARMVVVTEPREERDSMLDEFTAFVESLQRGDADTPVPKEHGLRVLRLLEAAEESSRRREEVRVEIG